MVLISSGITHNLDDINKEIPEIKHHQFRRLPFGLKLSPAISSRTVNHYLSLHSESDPDIINLLKNSLYVDNLLVVRLLQVYEALNEVLSKGGFPLLKWNTNS